MPASTIPYILLFTAMLGRLPHFLVLIEIRCIAHLLMKLLDAVEVFMWYLIFLSWKQLIFCDCSTCRIIAVLQCLVCCTTWSKRCFFQVWWNWCSASEDWLKSTGTRHRKRIRETNTVFWLSAKTCIQRWWKLHWLCKLAKPGLPEICQARFWIHTDGCW